MQIAGTTSQATTTAATPVQPLGSPTSTQAGNVVMVIIIKYVYISSNV